MEDLKIDRARVVEAAKSCPDAAKVLKTLFPDAFPDETPKPTVPFLPNVPYIFPVGHPMRSIIQVDAGNLPGSKENGLYLLGSDYEFTLEKVGSSSYHKVLRVTRKVKG